MACNNTEDGITRLWTNDHYPVEWQVNTDLTGTTVEVLLRLQPDTSPVQRYTGTVTDATTGKFTWPYAGELAVGYYLGQVELTRGADKRTAPTQDYYAVEVQADLDGA